MAVLTLAAAAAVAVPYKLLMDLTQRRRGEEAGAGLVAKANARPPYCWEGCAVVAQAAALLVLTSTCESVSAAISSLVVSMGCTACPEVYWVEVATAVDGEEVVAGATTAEEGQERRMDF